MPRLDMTTEDGGELPGVSRPLATVDLSFETMLEMESLSCWLGFSAKISSTIESVSFMLFRTSAHRDCISVCNLRISPLTVSRSLTPRSTMDSTRSIAGP